MSLTRTLVRQINSKPITSADREQAALLVLDALASAYAGSVTDVGKRFLTWSERRGDASVCARSFLLGAITHITETDDLHRGSVTHPGCVVIPAVLALSSQQRFNNHQLLDAVIRGFEAVCRVGMSVGPTHYKVWHNTSTCGPFGSAMAIGDLLQLDEDQLVWALGNAGTQASGLWEFLSDGAMSKHVHAGRGSEAGVLAAELASLGVTGAEKILDGDKGFYKGLCPDPDSSQLNIPGDAPWQVHQTSIKPWPSCRHTHPAIDAALELSGQLGNSLISEVAVETYQAALDLCDRTEALNEYQAKFSLQHCVATALSNGEVHLDSFDESARSDAQDLSKRVSVACESPFSNDYPAAWGARVSVTTTDDRVLEASRHHCKGDPENALDSAAMQAKALGLLHKSGLSEQQANALCHSILAMPDAQQEVDTSALYPKFQAGEFRGES